MKSIRTLGKWQCCGENDCFKQEILSRWNSSFMWGSCTFLGWVEKGYAAGAGTILGSGQASILVEKRVAVRKIIQLHAGSSSVTTQGDAGSVSRPIKLPELLLHLLQGCTRSVSSPTQAETLLIYSHGLWGHQVSPDDLLVCRTMSCHTQSPFLSLIQQCLDLPVNKSPTAQQFREKDRPSEMFLVDPINSYRGYCIRWALVNKKFITKAVVNAKTALWTRAQAIAAC